MFIARPGGGLTAEQAAQRVLRRFLERAWRRPPTAGDMARALDQYREARQSDRGFEEAVKVVLQAALISPKFLLRTETPAGGTDAGAHRISDWDLASRLSYFLWASMPDAELRNLASRGELSDPEVLDAQVDRCWPIRRPTRSEPASRRSGSASSTSGPGSGSIPSTTRGAPPR